MPHKANVFHESSETYLERSSYDSLGGHLYYNSYINTQQLISKTGYNKLIMIENVSVPSGGAQSCQRGFKNRGIVSH